jgi:diguanylate cyclase (GGDEF)-like protein
MMDGCILIVDDDEVDRKIISRILTKIGWKGEIIEASDLTQACELASTHKCSCIFIDYHIPGTDGLEILNALLNNHKIKAPIVMLTAEGNELVAVEAMKRGAFDYLPKSLLSVNTLARILRQAIDKTRLLDELAKAHDLLEHQAQYDSLTDLGNRSLFRRELDRKIAISKRNNSAFCLLMMDLDRFKAVNDTYGHYAGDAVLAEVSLRLKAITRADASFYRPGGDEFTAIIDVPSQDATSTIIHRIVKSINLPINFDTLKVSVGISVGVAFYPVNGGTSDDLIRVADAAMYKAKGDATHIVYAKE